MKTTPYQRSLRDIKGIRYARISSIPKQQRSAHLDLYLLSSEKKRLEKELFQLQHKLKLVKKRLHQANKHMRDLIKEIGKSADVDLRDGKRGQRAAPLVRKMKIGY